MPAASEGSRRPELPIIRLESPRVYAQVSLQMHRFPPSCATNLPATRDVSRRDLVRDTPHGLRRRDKAHGLEKVRTSDQQGRRLSGASPVLRRAPVGRLSCVLGRKPASAFRANCKVLARWSRWVAGGMRRATTLIPQVAVATSLAASRRNRPSAAKLLDRGRIGRPAPSRDPMENERPTRFSHALLADSPSRRTIGLAVWRAPLRRTGTWPCSASCSASRSSAT